MIFSLEKDITDTLKKDEKVSDSDKSWDWSLEVTVIRSHFGSYNSISH